MKKILILSIALIAFSSCKNKTADPTKTEVETVQEAQIETNAVGLEPSCYAYEGNGSKVTLNITDVGDEVSGTLTYMLLEKDTNTGSFKGYFEDSVLIAEYTFLSEGIQSTREVAFHLQNDQFIEGYGEVEVEGTVTRFKDSDAVQFTSSMPLSKTECPA